LKSQYINIITSPSLFSIKQLFPLISEQSISQIKNGLTEPEGKTGAKRRPGLKIASKANRNFLAFFLPLTSRARWRVNLLAFALWQTGERNAKTWAKPNNDAETKSDFASTGGFCPLSIRMVRRVRQRRRDNFINRCEPFKGQDKTSPPLIFIG